jgi:hypothetical protein
MKNINDLITIKRTTSGQFKFSQNISNQANVYKYLYELGFRFTKIKNKRFYYRRDQFKLVPIYFQDIKDAFKNALDEFNFSNIPNGLSKEDVVNWFYHRRPIKNGGFFEAYLSEDLSDFELNQLIQEKIKLELAFQVL